MDTPIESQSVNVQIGHHIGLGDPQNNKAKDKLHFQIFFSKLKSFENYPLSEAGRIAVSEHQSPGFDPNLWCCLCGVCTFFL